MAGRDWRQLRALLCIFCALHSVTPALVRAANLESGFADPPRDSKLRAYWWWLNGNVTKASITRDLEEMSAKGLGGALICDAGGAEQDGNDTVPHGPDFLSPEWRELYRHTLHEAQRLGLEMSLNIQSGWNLGGPMVTADDAAKKLVWSEVQIEGPAEVEQALPSPKARDNYYRDQWVVAFPLKSVSSGDPGRRSLQNFELKAVHKSLSFSAPDTTPLFQEWPAQPGEEQARASDVIDITPKLGPDGVLRWKAPAGRWQVLRFGCTIGDHSRVSTSSDGWKGYALDVLDAGAFERYWDAVLQPLIADAGSLAGKTLKYLHTDSWEVEAINWTPSLRQEFKTRRGYDLLPYLPVIAGRIIDSRPLSNRFLHDFRKTLGDLAIDHHYRLFRDRAHQHGLQIHPESGGPHASPIDAQRCLGWDDAPMSEFWAWSWRHRVGDENRFFVKQPASAAHTYGHRLVLAEGFTTIGPHWQETLWDNLKPSFDKALCEGLNMLVWHAFVCSPESMGMPGQQYFAGTHLNPNTTWWAKSAAFFSYLNRSQFMLQQGRFAADVCYYYGDHVPNFAQLKSSDPARILPGYDYDVITEETILTQLSVRDGRLVLPDGMSYRILVLPPRSIMSLPVLRKLKELVAAGATVIGPKPAEASGLQNFPACDVEVRKLADQLWSDTAANGSASARPLKGRVISGRSAREVLSQDGVPPDFECTVAKCSPDPADLLRSGNAGAAAPPAAARTNNAPALDYIHREVAADNSGGIGSAPCDIYFVANRSNNWLEARCTFRVSGKAPELWNPVTGERQFASAYEEAQGRTTVPLEFAPCGSWFVVFREKASIHPPTAKANARTFRARGVLEGAWSVAFDPKWGGPAAADFLQLQSWAMRPEPGIKYYSGTAVYRKQFDLPAGLELDKAWLDLGVVRELAEVRLNGRSLGVVWGPPFRVHLGTAARQGKNQLEIEVVNFWPNRIIGDQLLAPGERLTRTNIRKLTKDTPLMESGLLGPVLLLEQIEAGAL